MSHPYPSGDDAVAYTLLTIFGVILLVWVFVLPYFEARTFNKFSKTKATYFDAVVSDLRVIPDGQGK
jgi:hypothetical protein